MIAEPRAEGSAPERRSGEVVFVDLVGRAGDAVGRDFSDWVDRDVKRLTVLGDLAREARSAACFDGHEECVRVAADRGQPSVAEGHVVEGPAGNDLRAER